jgi:hypothetical protein
MPGADCPAKSASRERSFPELNFRKDGSWKAGRMPPVDLLSQLFCDGVVMNRKEIFVFKPLSTGLGLERAHDLRHAPGLWSGTTTRAAQAAKAQISRFVPSTSLQRAGSKPPKRSPLMMWQRFVAVWCDVMVCAALAMFALVCAGFFAAILDQSSTSPQGLANILSSFVWMRQSVQILIAMNNIASSLPWLPVAGFGVLFGTYRLAVSLIAGVSPGETLAKWLAGPAGS